MLPDRTLIAAPFRGDFRSSRLRVMNNRNSSIRVRWALGALTTWLMAAHPAAASPFEFMLVSSRDSDNVIRYDGHTGQFIDVFASGGGLDEPTGLTIGPDGNLYVANYTGNNILRYDGQTGAFIDVFSSSAGLVRPYGITFAPNGDLYVGSPATDRIIRLDGQTGVQSGMLGLIEDPLGLAVGIDGLLYVAEPQGVSRFDLQTGAWLGRFIQAGPSFTWFNDLAFGPDGNVYVTVDGFIGSPSLVRFDGQTGALIDIIATGGEVGVPGLEFGPGGYLFVADSFGDRITQWDVQTGSFVGTFATGGGLDRPAFFTYVPEPISVWLVAWAAVLALRRRARFFGRVGPRSCVVT